MHKFAAIVAGAALAATTLPAAAAEDASAAFSYSAPSGMFSEGTTKWQMYRFMHEDAEKMARARSGDPVGTGSIQGTATETETYRRPGESTLSPRRRP